MLCLYNRREYYRRASQNRYPPLIVAILYFTINFPGFSLHMRKPWEFIYYKRYVILTTKIRQNGIKTSKKQSFF